MLEALDLHAGYGAIPVLTGVSFTVAEGEFTGILGHNGMGKTTLLKALAGILPASAGRVRFEGQDITRLASHQRTRRGIGYVPQGREIFPGLSVLDNLRFAVAAKGRAEPDAIERVLAEFPRLQPLLGRAGGALSGGEQQLLALARCLVQAPRLVLLDEPTEGIQPSVIEAIAEKLAAAPAKARPHHDPGRAEPRFHQSALGPGAHHPKGPDHPRGGPRRSRRSGHDQRVHRRRLRSCTPFEK